MVRFPTLMSSTCSNCVKLFLNFTSKIYKIMGNGELGIRNVSRVNGSECTPFILKAIIIEATPCARYSRFSGVNPPLLTGETVINDT